MVRYLLLSPMALAIVGCATSNPESLASTAVEAAPSQDVAPSAPAIQWDGISAQMEEHKLAGLSIAVFDNYELVEVATFGSKEAGRDDPIGPDTAFSTASFAKPVTALLALMLDDDGLIDIDAPISQYLTRWQLPESEVPGADNVTMRQLLSHMGGTSQHGFADFYEGDPVPTLIDSVEGRLPRYDKPIEFLFEPGSSWQYSGGGYVIVQMAIEDHTGRKLADLAAERIFEPLGMARSSMAQPGEPGFLTDVAKVHDAEGNVIKTGLPITPQVAASGLWSTPTDLARFALAIQRGLDGEVGGIVTPAFASELTTIVAHDHVGGMAMPFFRGFGFGNTDWFRHDGSNTGVNIDMFASMEGGSGMIFMGNGDDPSTVPIFAYLRQSVIDQLGWADRNPLVAQPIPLELRQAIERDYTGMLYELGLPYTVDSDAEKLWIISPFFSRFLGKDRSEMRHLGDGVFAIMDYPNRLRFDLGEDGTVQSVTLFRPGDDGSVVVRSLNQ